MASCILHNLHNAGVDNMSVDKKITINLHKGRKMLAPRDEFVSNSSRNSNAVPSTKDNGF